MSGRVNSSIDLTKIMAAYKAKHSAFTVGKSNGHIYLSITSWLNDADDTYHHNTRHDLNSAKNQKDDDKAKLEPLGKNANIIGNGVWSMGLEGNSVAAGGDNALDDFAGGTAPATEAIDDLPF